MTDFAGILTAWAEHEPSVKALVLIGSRARPADDIVWFADAQSDWDFHVITSRPQIFLNAAWTQDLSGTELQAYAVRVARIGAVPKVNVIFGGVEADFVVINASSFRTLKMFTAMGIHRRNTWVRRKLQELAVVVRPGWRFLKGENEWGGFYQRAVAEVSDPRLSNEEACRLADGFVCDYVSVLRKITRGELIAAQRLTHRDLAEVNFRLLHELKLRRGQRTFPEVRRVERVADPQELTAITLDSRVEAAALSLALNKSAQTCSALMYDLVGALWHWPVALKIDFTR